MHAPLFNAHPLCRKVRACGHHSPCVRIIIPCAKTGARARLTADAHPTPLHSPPPPLPFPYPTRAQAVEAYVACHADHPVAKFFNACGDMESSMNACFKEEKELRRAINRAHPATSMLSVTYASGAKKGVRVELDNDASLPNMPAPAAPAAAAPSS